MECKPWNLTQGWTHPALTEPLCGTRCWDVGMTTTPSQAQELLLQRGKQMCDACLLCLSPWLNTVGQAWVTVPQHLARVRCPVHSC